MKKVFLLSVAGRYDEELCRRPQFPTGSVYSQQGQLFAVLALFEDHDGIQKLVESLGSNNSIAVKAANSAIRKLELPNVRFDDGKTVTYSRLNTVLRKEGRVALYKLDEDNDDVLVYVVWKMGVNEWPVMKTEDDGDEWWQKASRIGQEPQDE
jgi:hypothetical protein